MIVISKTEEFMLPTNDYVFKRLFGYKGNESFTKDLLKSILNIEIGKITVTSSVVLEKDLKDDKIGVLDVLAYIDSETQCDVEMQIVPYDNLRERILEYACKLYDNSIKSGKDYITAKKTIVIFIADFDIQYEKEIEEYHTTWHIREDKYLEMVLTYLFEFHIISLKKFEEEPERGNRLLRSWLKFIKNPNLMEDKDMENPEIKKAKEEYNKIAVDEHERYLAEQRLIRIMDEKAIRRGGFKDGQKEGEKIRN